VIIRFSREGFFRVPGVARGEFGCGGSVAIVIDDGHAAVAYIQSRCVGDGFERSMLQLATIKVSLPVAMGSGYLILFHNGC